MSDMTQVKQTSGLARRWRELTEPARAQWQVMAPRERWTAQLGLAALALFIGWWLLLAPALRTLNQAPAKRTQLEAQLQEMQALALEARELRALPPVPAAQALAALQAASDHLGGNARLSITGERATLSLNGVTPEALQAWMAEVRSAARARPVEAQLQRSNKGFTGSIVLALGGVNP